MSIESLFLSNLSARRPAKQIILPGDFMKRAVYPVLIAGGHFICCRMITVFASFICNPAAEGFSRLFFKLLVFITRILYFPVLTLSLYSRNWFPGDWVFIPIAINSLLWGVALYAIWCLWKRQRLRRVSK